MKVTARHKMGKEESGGRWPSFWILLSYILVSTVNSCIFFLGHLLL